MDYKQEFAEILKSYWNLLTRPGDAIELSDGSSAVTVHRDELAQGRWVQHIEIITELPDGKYVAWNCEEGLTEYQDSTGPAEFGEAELEDRVKKTETITVTKYVKD